jgi:uncharacterized protein
MFVGRELELNFFEERYKTEDAQLIVLYGRRRIGKTELLKMFSKNKTHIFHICRDCTDREQLQLFSKKMIMGSKHEEFLKEFSDWEQAFRFILELSIEGKKLLIIDEFPYMVKINTSIPSILQNLWDEVLKNENIMIVLCGSAMSFIEKEMLAEKNPLYGRATGILKMKEMDYFESSIFFQDYSLEEKILSYAILGGIPHYLKQFDRNRSLRENIIKNILSKGCILYSEVEFLLKQELRETSVYNTLIHAVAMGNTKLNDIFHKVQMDRAKISVYLKNLIELNIVEKEIPINETIKSSANTQRGLYFLKDNFFTFWYRFIFPNLSELEEGDVLGVYENLIEPYLEQYTSRVFEKICIQYLRKLNRSGILPVRFTKIGRFLNGDTEIDILAQIKGESYISGECKWKNSKVSIGDYYKLRSKVEGLKIRCDYYYLFSKVGFTEQLMDLAQKDQGLKLVELKDFAIV